MNIIQELQSRIDKRSIIISKQEDYVFVQKRDKNFIQRFVLENLKKNRVEQTLDKRLMARCIWDERLRVLYTKLLVKYSKVVAENVRLKGTFKEAREAE